MNIGNMLICFEAAVLSGLIHSSIGLGYGMTAMAILTLFLPYTDCAAIVSCALLIITVQISWSMRKNINWKLVTGPSVILLVGKVLGIVALMNVEAKVLRMFLGVFLVLYAVPQVLGIQSFQIKGTSFQGLFLCFLGGVFGGVFNVSGPAASIYFQAVCKEEPLKYAACLNFTFVPSAIAGVLLHTFYGNYDQTVRIACVYTVIGVILSTMVGIRILRKMNASRLRKLTYIFICIMGVSICIS